MGKVIFKTALKALAAVLAALVLAFAIMSLAFPRTMAQICESLGDYSFATGYASLSYTYTGDVDDLARCVDDSVLAYNDGNTVNYGESLIAHEKFSQLCEKRDSAGNFSYKQFVYGSVAAAKYRKGDKSAAVETVRNAVEGEGFPQGNAYGTLALAVIKAKDKDTAEQILSGMPSAPSGGEELKFYNAVKSELEKLTYEGEV